MSTVQCLHARAEHEGCRLVTIDELKTQNKNPMWDTWVPVIIDNGPDQPPGLQWGHLGDKGPHHHGKIEENCCHDWAFQWWCSRNGCPSPFIPPCMCMGCLNVTTCLCPLPMYSKQMVMKRLTPDERAVILEEQLPPHLKNTVVVDQVTGTWGEIEHIHACLCGTLEFKLAPENGGGLAGESLTVNGNSLLSAQEYIEFLKGHGSGETISLDIGRTPNGEALCIQAWPNFTVRVLKELISQELVGEIPATAFRLTFGEVELDPAETLLEAGIEDEATVNMLMSATW